MIEYPSKVRVCKARRNWWKRQWEPGKVLRMIDCVVRYEDGSFEWSFDHDVSVVKSQFVVMPMFNDLVCQRFGSDMKIAGMECPKC